MEIDVGAEGEVSLQSATPTGFNRVRVVAEDEAARVQLAVSFVRRYYQSNPIYLLLAGHDALIDAIWAAGQPSAGSVLPWHANRVAAGLVSWLLLWRLTLDQWLHNIGSRFGRTSSEYVGLKSATHHAYNGHRGYRITEAMRNLVAHREMPPLHINQRQTPGSDGQPHTQLSVTLDASWFLNWKDCPTILRAELKDILSPIDVAASIEDAMNGMSEILDVVANVDGPELVRSLALLQSLLMECKPGVPVLVTSESGEVGGDLRLTLTRLDDLVPFLRAAR